MKLLLQSHSWDCLPTAAAMVLDVLPKEIFEFLGHDGSEIVWPEQPEPLCRRSFSVDEIIDYCVAQIVYPVEIRASTDYGPENCEPYRNETDHLRLQGYMQERSGILLCEQNGKHHAVAWNNVEQMVYDPEGRIYGLNEGLKIFSFLAFC